MERRNNSLFSLLMTHDSCVRGSKREGENEAGGGKQRGLSVTEQGKWQIIHGFQKSVEAPCYIQCRLYAFPTSEMAA